MATISDIRSITPRSNRTRKVSDITHIARHHSATDTGNWASFWKYWHETKGWGTGGYHEIILRDGTVQLCYDPEEITNGVGGQNAYTYHITLVGNGSFTPAQEKTWEERALFNLKRFNLPVTRVLGHKEYPGANTACPGVDMGVVRNRLIYLLSKVVEAAITPVAKPIAKPVVVPNLHIAVVIGSVNDYESAELVASHYKAPIYPRGAIKGTIAKEIFVVGGTVEGLKAGKINNLSGKSRHDTKANVLKFLANK